MDGPAAASAPRTIGSAEQSKKKKEGAMSSSGLIRQRKHDKAAKAAVKRAMHNPSRDPFSPTGEHSGATDASIAPRLQAQRKEAAAKV